MRRRKTTPSDTRKPDGEGTGLASRRARVWQGIGGQVLNQPIGLLIQVLSVPVYLHFWGVDLYGEWLTLYAFPAYFRLSDIGFTAAATNRMTMDVAAGDREAALTSFQSGWLVVAGLGSGIAIVLSVLGYILPLSTWLNFTVLGASETGMVVALFALYMLAHLEAGFLQAGLTCEGRYGLGIAIAGIARLAEFVAVVIALVMGSGPVGAALALVVGRGVTLLALRVVLARVAPWLRHGVAHVVAARVRALTGPALGFLSLSVGNGFNIQGPVIVIGVVLGPTAAATFATLRMMTRAVAMVLASLSAIVRPEITMAVGRGDMPAARRLQGAASRFSLWLSLVAAAGLLLLGGWALNLWTGGRIAMDFPAFAILVAVMVVNTLWTTALWTLSAANRTVRAALLYTGANAAMLALAAILGSSHGIAGVTTALLAADIVMAPFILRWTFACLGERPVDFARALIRPPIAEIRSILRRAP